MRRAAIVIFVSCLALASGVALADAIGMEECQNGWVWTGHGHGGGCEPVICTSDAACGRGHCVEVARCMRTQAIDTGMAMPAPGAPVQTYEVPLAELCSPIGVCGGGAHCRHAAECVPSSGGCSAFPSRGSPWILALAALASLTFASRTRRRDAVR